MGNLIDTFAYIHVPHDRCCVAVTVDKDDIALTARKYIVGYGSPRCALRPEASNDAQHEEPYDDIAKKHEVQKGLWDASSGR